VSHDDDGAKADETTDNGPISKEQTVAILRLVEETGTDIEKFCAYFKVEAVPDLPASQFERAMKSLEKKRGAQ